MKRHRTHCNRVDLPNKNGTNGGTDTKDWIGTVAVDDPLKGTSRKQSAI